LFSERLRSIYFGDPTPRWSTICRAVRRWSWLLAALLFGAACADSGTTGDTSPAPSPGVNIEVDEAGAAAFYISSDNVDPSSLPKDDANSHAIASLPSGLVQICKYTLSQGVNWTVWAIAGTPDSVDLAKAYCAQNGK